MINQGGRTKDRRSAAVASIVLSTVAIGLVPCVFLAVMYDLFGYPTLAWLPFVFAYAPLTASALGVGGLISALIARRHSKHGWLLISYSCFATLFPWVFLFAAFHWFGWR